MAILRVEPNVINSNGAYTMDSVTANTVVVSGAILPTVSNVINIGSPTQRFGTLYLAGNTIDIGGAQISSTEGNVSFATASGNIELNQFLIDFLSNISTSGPAGVQGETGYTGSAGTAGSTGFTGSQGVAGPAGSPGGYTGSVGFVGSKGDPNGYTGSQGFTGSSGADGAAGAAGAAGFTGSAGPAGGYTGSRGDTGFVGSKGDTGNIGFTGSQGIPGAAADKGYTGSLGFVGSQGNTGDTGFTGSQGIQGNTGFVGSQGSLGYSGSIGFTGSQGIPGAAADKGYTGSQGDIGYSGSIGFTGSQGIPGAAADKGFTGSVGFTGSTGSIGGSGFTGSQGIPGAAADKGYTGSQGATGFAGSTGDTGATGATGFVGSQGIQGIQGTTGFVGSQGNLGYSGSKGDTGLGFAIAKTYASVAALTADTSPTGIAAGQFAIIDTGNVNDTENSRLYLWTGSAYNYVNDLSGAIGLTGPQGTTGFAGSQGIQGTTGFAGSQGDLGYTGSTGTGFTGSTGSTGFTGSTGISGFSGSSAGVFTATAAGSITAGRAVILNANATVSAVGTVTTAFSPSSTANQYASTGANSSIAYDVVNNRVYVAYQDAFTGRLTVVVGTPSGTSTTWGTPADSGISVYSPTGISCAFDVVSGRLVVVYTNSGGTATNAVVCTFVAGPSVTFGTPVQVYAGLSYLTKTVYDDSNGKTVIFYKYFSASVYNFAAAVGTVSGTTISFGSPTVLYTAASSSYDSIFDTVYNSTGSNIIVVYADGASGSAVIGTVSGTAISFGSAAIFRNAATNTTYGSLSVTYDSGSARIVVAYTDASNTGYVSAGSISGTAITFGSAATITNLGSAATVNFVTVAYDALANRTFLAAFRSSNNSQWSQDVIINDLAVTTAYPSTNWSNIPGSSSESSYGALTHIDSIYLAGSVNKVMYILIRSAGAGAAYSVLVTGYQITTNAGGWFGLSAGSYTNGQLATITVLGGVNTNQTGLTPNATYYIGATGTVSSSAPGYGKVGVALSSTSLLVTNQTVVGYTGSAGYLGSFGYTGSTGSTGFTGSRGTTGFVGSQGNLGFTGSVGAGFTGSRGDTGFVGSQGNLGYTGSIGPAGPIGYVGSLPTLSTPYVLTKTNSGATSIAASTTTQIALNTVVSGDSSISSTNGFTVLRAGLYDVDVVYFTNSSSHINVSELWGMIYVNGVETYRFYEGFPQFGNDKGISGSKVLQLAANDVVTVYFWCFGTTLQVAAQSVKVTVTELVQYAGYTGSQGVLGYSGSIGFTGSTGAGFVGSAGFTGSLGSTGFTGSTGVGFAGSIGFTGSTGVGFTGSAGAAGAQGVIGYTGSAGTGGGGGGGTGYTGSAGTPGTLASGQVTNTFTGDGTTTAFTLSVAPVSKDAVTVNIDGVTQQRSGFTVSGFILTLDEAPLSGEVIEVTIATYGTTNFVARTYTGDGVTSNFAVTLGTTVNSVIVTENGVVQTPTTDYTIAGNVLTILGGAPAAGTTVGIREIPAGAVGGNSIYSRTSITATAGQTSFAVAYNVGFLEVYFNGALLNAIDYTATNGSTVVLTLPAVAGDIVEFITYNVVPVTQVPTATFNSTNLTANLAITAGYSAVSVGPINIANGVTVSIADGQKWVIL